MSEAVRIYITADCGCRFLIIRSKPLERDRTCENHMGDPW